MDAGGGQLAGPFLGDLADGTWAVFAQKGVNGLHPVDSLLGVLGQVFVGVVHVDVLRVAAAGGQRHREQRRGVGGWGVVGMVGVELFAGDDAPAVLDLIVGDVVNSGMAGDV